MEASDATYSVVLRQDIPPRERELLQHLCGQITSASGEPLLHFLCTRIDLSHHVFAELQAFKPGDDAPHPVRIPHQYIFLISGDGQDAPIGFTALLDRSP